MLNTTCLVKSFKGNQVIQVYPVKGKLNLNGHFIGNDGLEVFLSKKGSKFFHTQSYLVGTESYHLDYLVRLNLIQRIKLFFKGH